MHGSALFLRVPEVHISLRFRGNRLSLQVPSALSENRKPETAPCRFPSKSFQTGTFWTRKFWKSNAGFIINLRSSVEIQLKWPKGHVAEEVQFQCRIHHGLG